MDWPTFLILVGALGLGAAHAFEVDHMTAVSTFVAGKPTPRQAMLFGIKWSIGHGFSLLVLGSLIYALKWTFSPSVESGLERVVGVALFVLGIWTLFQLRTSFLAHTHSHHHDGHQPHSHGSDEAPHTHASGEQLPNLHTHADNVTHAHPHRHDSLWMGVLHGAAGTAAFITESLVAVSQSYWKVFAFTLSFSIGVLIAMATYSLVLGSILSYGERRSQLFIHSVRALTGIWACAVGIYWVVK